MGALSGAATAGIGQAFGSVGGIGKELGRASAHALAGGGISKLRGGDFWSGAAAGGLGSATGSLLNKAKPHWQIVGSALSGGIGAELGGGDFLQGAAFGGIIAGANHLSHSKIRKIKKLLREYDGAKHPGKLNLKGAKRNDVAIHLLKGLKYHMTNQTDIDLLELFDCLSTECLGIGGTHLMSRTKQSWVNSFLGPSGDLFANVKFGNRLVKMMYEIPFHGPKNGLKFEYFRYQQKPIGNGNWKIWWGDERLGLRLTFGNHTNFMKKWLLK